MSVRELAPAIMALSDLVQKTGRTVYGEEAEVALHVQATDEGSFVVFLQLIAENASEIKELFGSETANSLANLLQILGLSGLLPGAYGLFQLLKDLQGRTPEKTTEANNRADVVMEFPDGSVLEIRKEVFELFSDPEARQQVRRVVKPLENPGIDEFIARDQSLGPPLRVTRDELPYFDPPDDEQPLGESITERVFSIIKPAFKEDNKWRLSDGTDAIWAIMSDEDFLERVEKGEQFSSRDYLRVKLVTRQWHTQSGLQTEYEIPEVIEHIKPNPQLNAFGESQTNED